VPPFFDRSGFPPVMHTPRFPLSSGQVAGKSGGTADAPAGLFKCEGQTLRIGKSVPWAMPSPCLLRCNNAVPPHSIPPAKISPLPSH